MYWNVIAFCLCVLFVCCVVMSVLNFPQTDFLRTYCSHYECLPQLTPEPAMHSVVRIHYCISYWTSCGGSWSVLDKNGLFHNAWASRPQPLVLRSLRRASWRWSRMKQPLPCFNVSKNHTANRDTPASQAPVGQIERARGNKYYTLLPGENVGLWSSYAIVYCQNKVFMF